MAGAWGGAAGAETVTYTVTSTSAVNTSGTAPFGSSATYSSKYNEKFQLIGGKSMTLTLSGYAGKKITGITLSMKSNSSKGAGYLSVKAGTSTLASIGSPSSGVKFNNSAWHGSWSTSYVDVTPTMSNSAYAIQDKDEVVILIGATANSLYCKSFTLTYEDAGSGSSVPSPTFSLASGTYYGNQTLELSSTVDGGTIYYTKDGSDPSDSETVTEYTTPISLTAPSTLTIKAIVMDSEANLSSVVTREYTIVPSIANTKETAYTTEEAIALIDATSDEQLAAEKVYVKGTISKVDSYNSTYKSITYWLDDNKFEVYSGRGLDNADFSAKTDIEVGAEVIIYGNITKYNTTYEFDKNNYLVSYSVAAKTLESVAISGTPTQTTYEVGEAFNTAGLTVTAHYSDGSSKEITSGITWNVTPETLTAGVTSVSVTATVDEVTSEAFIINGITVRALQSVTLEGFPTKTSYSVGEIFDPTGIKVMANYTTGDPKDVTSEAIFNFDNSALTLSTTSMAVTATYGGMTSAEQNYTITVLKTIVPFAPKVIYRKITSTADIVDGGVYLIVCEARNEAMGSLNSSSSRGEGEPITISGNTYTGKVNQSGYPYEITISQAKNGNYNLYHASGYFINGKNGNELVFSTTTGDDGWSVIFDEDGNVEISNSKKEGNYIQRHKTSNYYKNYSSSSGGQTPVQLYQKFGEMSIAQVTGGITTYVADFAYSMPQHLVGHTVTQADKAGVITTHKAFRAGEEVPALTPLLIKSTEDYEETSKTYYPAVLNKSVAAYEGDNMLEYNRDAYGLTKTTNSESVYYYKLAIKNEKVGFYWGADEGAAFQMTKPSTAYLTVPQTMSVQGFVLNLEEGEPTGIATVTTDENAPIYNLQGIRMNGKNLPKGIYIQGGKKFMVK